jgi:hypothetical protein
MAFVLLLYHFLSYTYGTMLYRLERCYTTILLIIFGGIVIYTPFSVYLGTKFPSQMLLIKSWKEMLIIVATILACIIVTKRQLWGEFSRDLLMRLIIAYVTLHFLLVAVHYQGSTATYAGLAIDLRFVAFFALIYLLMKISPMSRKKILTVGAIGATVVIGFGTMLLFLPKDTLAHIGYSTETISPYLTVDKNLDYIRINSTLRGPNPLGAYAVIILSLIATFVAAKTSYFTTTVRRIGLLTATVGSGTVLWVSYSRSSFLAFLTAMIVIAGILYRRYLTSRRIAFLGISICVLIIGIVTMAQTSFVANVIFHDNEKTKGISSNEAHLSSITTNLTHALEQPFGTGVGSTGSAAVRAGKGVIVENQYLFEIREGGWLGLALFAGIYGVIMQRLYAARKDWLSLGVFASGVGMAIIGLLLPVWADDTVSIVWWGFAAVAIGGVCGRTTTNQKTA